MSEIIQELPIQQSKQGAQAESPDVAFNGQPFGIGDTISFSTSRVPEGMSTQPVWQKLEMNAGPENLSEQDERAKIALDVLDKSAPSDMNEYPYLSAAEYTQLGIQGGKLAITTEKQPIAIPTSAIVRVPDMEGWNDFHAKDETHIKVKVRIGHRLFRTPWAKQEKPAPVTGLARAFVQPNGKIFVVMINNGAHTVSIARGKREPYVQFVGTMDFVTIDKNIYPEV